MAVGVHAQDKVAQANRRHRPVTQRLLVDHAHDARNHAHHAPKPSLLLCRLRELQPCAAKAAPPSALASLVLRAHCQI
eukprot:6214071-Pleurochrysis_carterae.AAC.3